MMHSIWKVGSVNIGPRRLAQITRIRMNLSSTNHQKIDTSMYVPYSTNNIDIVSFKNQPTDTKISCVHGNTNNINDISYASNNGNITLSKSNQQKSWIELIPISDPQNMSTPTYQSTSAQTASDIMSNLLTKQASSMEELLDNAVSIE